MPAVNCEIFLINTTLCRSEYMAIYDEPSSESSAQLIKTLKKYHSLVLFCIFKYKNVNVLNQRSSFYIRSKPKHFLTQTWTI